MMRCMQDSPPENPDPFALHMEKSYSRQPPLLRLQCQKSQAWSGKFKQTSGAAPVFWLGNTSDAGGSGTPKNSPKNRLSERS